MKLAEALRTIQQAPAAGNALRAFLACGFTPLHLQTFLAAHLQQSSPDRRIELQSGLYGDCAGNLDRARETAPDAVAVVLEWPDFDPRLGIRQLGGWDPGQLADVIETTKGQARRLREHIERTAETVPVCACLPTLPLPPASHKPGWEGSVFEAQLHQVIGEMAVLLSGNPNVRLVSRQRIDALSPLADRLDVRSELASGFPYRLAHASVLGQLLARLIRPPAPKKGLITDLDDVLWRGILGEVGADGVSWDLDRKSQVHGLYQQFLRSLAEAGVLIAVASKNDPSRVAEALRREDLVITPGHLFPIHVHWGAKSQSVRDIIRTWNLGADSVVFVDDSPIELAEVAGVHPAVTCLRFTPDDEPGVYRLLEELRDLFGKSRLSEEDALRRESLRGAARLAEDAGAQDGPSNEFLSAVDAEVTIVFGKNPPDARALELVNKTNQFNLNGQRYTEGEWQAYLKGPGTFLAVVAYKDKYGPLGKIAAVTGRAEGAALFVDTWVMSCRAFARRIEHRCVEVLLNRYRADEVVFDYRQTDRNAPVQDFLRAVGSAPTDGRVRLTREAFAAVCPPLFHRVRTLDNG